MNEHKRKHDYVLFERLTKTNMLMARLCHALGFEVRYLHLAATLHVSYQDLKNRRIEGLSYEFLDHGMLKLYTRLKEIPLEITHKTLATSCIHASFVRLHKLNEAQKRKLAFCLNHMLAERYQSFIELGVFAKQLSELPNTRRVYLWATADAITRLIETLDRRLYRNLKPRFVEALSTAASLTKKAFRRLTTSAAMQATASPTTQATSTPSLPAEQCEVLYFPHVGIYYGDLYMKDHYYSDAPESPFHPSKILHLSLGEQQHRLEKSIAFYRANNIPYGDINDLRRTSSLTIAKETIKLVLLDKSGLVSDLLKKGSASLVGHVKVIFEFYSFLHSLMPLTKAKIALSGHDILFSPVLSLALSVRGITTIATQERLVSAWYDHNLPILDHYFVIGQIIADELKRKKHNIAIEQVTPLGPVRLDLIYEQQQEPHRPSKYDAIKSKSLLILALDFYSPKTEEANRLVMGNSWKNTRRFYSDLIALAKAFPSIHIVIKGKNADFLEMPVFADTVRQLEQMTNISVEREYSTFTPARMVNLADGIIALHTSLADEAMAAGKPVIIYDYFGFPTDFFDYERLPAIAQDFNQLQECVERLVRRIPLIDENRMKALQARCYHNSFDGKVRRRLISKLEEIHSQLK